VTQSLVHNIDRISWILKEEMPAWCFGLGGRGSSFGEVYGDMFDHHTAVYEYASGARLYALCRTEAGCYDNSSDIVMGTKGKCYLGDCRIEGETKWRFKGPHNNPYDAEQKALIESVRNGQPINSGYHMANSTMIGVLGQLACYSGKPIRWDEIAKSDFPVRSAAGRGEFPDASAQPAGRHGQLPAAAARRDQVYPLSHPDVRLPGGWCCSGCSSEGKTRCSSNPCSFLARNGCCSFFNAPVSIWRTRSRLTEKIRPMSAKV
jgi:hypothetical protein